MDYEKKYKEALNWMKDVYPTLEGATKEDAEHYFPELKESEDERIRKWIIDDIKYNMNNETLNNSEYKKKAEKAIAWLEKQGEQKPANKVEPKFKVGDKVYALRNRFECTIESVDETTYYGDTTNFDIKDQDSWELVEHNLAWSEEDEETLGWLCTFLKEYGHKFYGGNEENVIDWLKSLKERYTWKPSDEQMKQLGWIAEQNKDNMIGKELMTLYQDLNKLMEE